MNWKNSPAGRRHAGLQIPSNIFAEGLKNITQNKAPILKATDKSLLLKDAVNCWDWRAGLAT